jgi:Phosphoribosylpyrophosphate synthetase
MRSNGPRRIVSRRSSRISAMLARIVRISRVCRFQQARGRSYQYSRYRPGADDGPPRGADPGVLQCAGGPSLCTACVAGLHYQEEGERLGGRSRQTPGESSGLVLSRSGSKQAWPLSTSGVKDRIRRDHEHHRRRRRKSALLLDDMIDTAGTIVKGAQACMDRGAREVWTAVPTRYSLDRRWIGSNNPV